MLLFQNIRPHRVVDSRVDIKELINTRHEEAADEGSNRSTADYIDGNAGFFKCTDHTNMGDSSRTATAQNKAD